MYISKKLWWFLYCFMTKKNAISSKCLQVTTTISNYNELQRMKIYLNTIKIQMLLLFRFISVLFSLLTTEKYKYLQSI